MTSIFCKNDKVMTFSKHGHVVIALPDERKVKVVAYDL
jgi:hypothetical protein